MKRISLFLFFVLFLQSALLQAQNEPAMADGMRSSGKIWVVVGVVGIILAGIFIYLFLTDRKISRLEKDINSKK